MNIEDDIDLYKATDTLRSYLPKGRKRSPKGWESFNCVMCSSMGEPSRDTKRKGNIIFDGPSMTYRCWRCKFKASYRPGLSINKNFERLLVELGVSSDDIRNLKIHENVVKQMTSTEQFTSTTNSGPREDFQRIELPKGAFDISSAEGGGFSHNSEGFVKALLYVEALGERLLDYPIYYAPEVTEQQMNERIIYPFFYEDKIVGYTARYFDKDLPSHAQKYIMNSPDNFLFNNKYLMDWSRKYVILVEGCADAIPINGVAYLKDTLTKGQINWINASGKEVILVPDRGESAGAAVQQAITNKWAVSMPEDWSRKIKDVHDAYLRYGALYTLESILDDKLIDKTKINKRWNEWK